MTLRQLAALGFWIGALLYGGMIALLHVVHNPGLGLASSLVLATELALLYGVGAMAAVALGGTAVQRLERHTPRLWKRLWQRIGQPTPLFAGLLVFHLVFWEMVALYGITYDQTLLIRPRTWVGMTLYLVLAAALLAGLLAVASVLLARALTVALARWGGRPLAVAGCMTLLVATTVAAVAGKPAASPERGSIDDVDLIATNQPIVLLGFDGLDPSVVDRLLGEGRLENLRRFMQQGVRSDLQTLPDANSAVIWASIYTGKEPRRHGVLDFYQVDLPGVAPLYPVHRTWFKEIVGLLEGFGLARRRPIARSSLQQFPIWEISDHLGLSTGVVDGYLYSYPAYQPETEESYFLSYGLDSWSSTLADEQPRGTELDETAARVVDYVQPIDLFPLEHIPRGTDFDWQREAILELLQNRPQPRFLSFYTHQPDALQHEAWRRFEPWRYPGGAGAEQNGESIEQLHERFDAFLGELVAATDPDTSFLLVSDHGHVPTMVHRLDTQHRHGPPGVLVAWGPAFGRGVELEDANVLDIFPTLLYLLGLPVPDDAPGRVLRAALSDDAVGSSTRIPTYEGLWRPRIREVERSRELDEQEIEKLRKMGYIALLLPPPFPSPPMPGSLP